MDPDTLGALVLDLAGLSAEAPLDGGATVVAECYGLDLYEQLGAHHEAALAVWAGRTTVVLRAGLTAGRANFLVARETVRYVAREERIDTDEATIARAAAWVVSPPAPFQAWFDRVGFDAFELARPFAITPCAAVLRLNEAVGLELAVVGRRTIHRRSPRLLGLLSDQDLRTLAAKRAPKSVRRVSLRADGGAVALIAC